MILKKEKIITRSTKAIPEINVSFRGIDKKATGQFYESQIVAGYQTGPRNPYVDELMNM